MGDMGDKNITTYTTRIGGHFGPATVPLYLQVLEKKILKVSLQYFVTVR